VTSEGKTTDRRAHTRPLVGARRETDSRTHPGTEGPLASAYTRAPDPRRGGSAVCRLRLAHAHLRTETRRCVTQLAPTGAAPRASRRVAGASDLLVKFRLREVRHFKTDHGQRRRVDPPTRRRARDTMSLGDGEIPGALDESPEAMIVMLLRTECRHADDHQPFAHAAQHQFVEDIAGSPDVRSDGPPPRRQLAPKCAECPCRQLAEESVRRVPLRRSWWVTWCCRSKRIVGRRSQGAKVLHFRRRIAPNRGLAASGEGAWALWDSGRR
jgi:hypothetical protein